MRRVELVLILDATGTMCLCARGAELAAGRWRDFPTRHARALGFRRLVGERRLVARARRLLAAFDAYVGRLDDHEVWAGLGRRLERGELRLLWRERPAFAPPLLDAGAEPPKSSSFLGEAETTWIEIVLLDAVGRPAPGVRVRVVQPDGVVDEGATDDRGRVRVERLPHGECKVSFPDLDSEAWEAIAT